MERMIVFITSMLLASDFIVSAIDQERKRYIAYMGSLPEGDYTPSVHHAEIIKEIVDSRFASKSLLRSYKRSFNGFAANLTRDEKDKLAGYHAVVSVFPCQKLKLQTTRSWDFMGVSKTVQRLPAIESNIIIGVIDTGIWPESESFKDQGLGPIPSKWKGVCQGGNGFACNRKIIGARVYSIENIETDNSARDVIGHGTHVASIAAGNEVPDTKYYGLAHGIARGGVPSARVAVYKACGQNCYITDLLSAFDDAIADGVDIISISVDLNNPYELTSDPIAVGAFHGMLRGVVTVNSAGNAGPLLYSIKTYAPWVITVAASDIDRKIINKLLLGKDAIVTGNGINAKSSSDGMLPLVYGKEVTSRCSETDARNCLAQCIDSSLVEQKVVLCDQKFDKTNIAAVKIAGALGCIVPNPETNVSLVMPYPIVGLDANSLNLVKKYKNDNTKPEVQILRSEEIENPAAPLVAAFSSRGPIRFLPDIIKPDVTAPGVEILAAFSPLGSPSGFDQDRKSVMYSIISGTSMACPHVTAAAAYVKSFHPDWSPSAIKSALMTTARAFNDGLNSEAEFSFGSGHIDPVKATDPGLVYETSPEEYLKIWCNISRTAGSWTATNANCPLKLSFREINYPSMAAHLTDTKDAFKVSFSRTVTNVGRANSTYVASVKGINRLLRVRVEPSILQFSALNQKKNFVVTVRGKRLKPWTIKRASLLWTDGVHKVISPIVVYTGQSTSGAERAPTPSMFHMTFVIFVYIKTMTEFSF